MSEAQSETFSPHNITVLGGLLLLAVFIGEVVIGPTQEGEMVAEQPVDTMDDMMMRIKPVVSLDDMKKSMMMASADGSAAAMSPEELYQGACLACHNTGAAGAPKLGDEAAWSERMAKGLDALVASAINGIGAMPARGGAQYSDDQVRAAVEYLLENSGADIQAAAAAEPAPAATSEETTMAAAPAAAKSPEELYQGACLACHNTGAAGAPKLGDPAAWSERLGKGVDALVASAINGIGAMPPRGGSQLSDDEVRAAVEYLLDNSK